MKDLFIWLTSLSRWLFDWRFFLLSLLIVTFPFLFGIFFTAEESFIRIYGMILQLLGICTVVWDINTTRKTFGHPGVLKVWHQRLKRFPLWGKQASTCSGYAMLPALTSFGCNCDDIARTGSEANIEERLVVLENNIQLVNNRISNTQKEYDERFRKSSEEFKREKLVRDQEVKIIHTKIETTETSGLYVIGMGALWLFQGVIMSTIPLEISKLFK